MAIHEEVCNSFAPTAFAAEITIATEPPNPTRTATNAEITIELRTYYYLP